MDLQDVARQKLLESFLGLLPSSKTTNRTVTISDYYVGCFACLFGHKASETAYALLRSFPAALHFDVGKMFLTSRKGHQEALKFSHSSRKNCMLTVVILSLIKNKVNFFFF